MYYEIFTFKVDYKKGTFVEDVHTHLSLSPHMHSPPSAGTHLSVTESQEVHREVGLNAINGSRQSDSTEQQHSQDHIGHGGCDPHNLKESHTHRHA